MESYRPLISIVTPAYNHEKFVGGCIESVLNQTYDNWEQIVVDDGSTDRTGEIVRSYKDKRIKYVYQKNLGVGKLATTINRGVALSGGELVTMFASDDKWPTDRLESQISVFMDPKVVLCFGDVSIIDEHDRLIKKAKRLYNPKTVNNNPPGVILRELLVLNFIYQNGVLIRRSSLDQIGGYLQPEGLLAEDFPTHLALATIGEFRFLPKLLGYYRMHGSQMTRNHYLNMAKSDIPYAQEFFRKLPPETQKLTGWTEETLSKQLQNQLYNKHFESGRRGLIAKDWVSSRRDFRVALFKGSFVVKLKASLGILCSLAHKDIEWFSHLTGLGTPLR